MHGKTWFAANLLFACCLLLQVHISSQNECLVPFGVGMTSDPMSMRRGGKKLPMEDVCYYQWPLPGIDQVFKLLIFTWYFFGFYWSIDFYIRADIAVRGVWYLWWTWWCWGCQICKQVSIANLSFTVIDSRTSHILINFIR